MIKNSLAKLILNDDTAIVGIKEGSYDVLASALSVEETQTFECYDESFKISRLNNEIFYLFVSSGLKGWIYKSKTTVPKLFSGPCFVDLNFEELVTVKLKNNKTFSIIVTSIPNASKYKTNIVVTILMLFSIMCAIIFMLITILVR